MNPNENQPGATRPRVLVTGASRGIGRAICERLATDGYTVIGLARRFTGTDSLPFTAIGVDLADPEATRRCLAGLLADGPFYGLVNNVALAEMAPLGEISDAAFAASIRLNLGVAIQCAEALLPGMRAAGRGRIVNLSSRSALGKAGRTVYSATKAGLIGMTRTWALETARDGITVNAVAPGPIDTELFRETNPPHSEAFQRLRAAIPVGRMGLPEEVAHAVSYFIDPRAGYVTGQTHFVCGGMTIGAG